VRVQLDRTTISFTLETGDDESVEFLVQGNPVTVTRAGVVTVELTPAPVLKGKPSVRDIEGFVREDGSVVRATVPPHPMIDEPAEATD
jgi:alpha,alpha-trehalose phosphorylase